VFTPGDYHLSPESVCIDAGDPLLGAPALDFDFDGESRSQNCRVDIGVDEFTQDFSFVLGDLTGDGFVTVADIPEFAEVLVNGTGLGFCAADMNLDHAADGRDIDVFMFVLFNS